MTLGTGLLMLYAATTALALTMTYREQRQRGQARPAYAVIGYMACTVWPLMAMVFLVSRA